MATINHAQPSDALKPTSAYLALIGGIICIGFSAIFTRAAATTGDVAAAWRLGIAALVLTPAAIINWRRGRARLPRSVLWLVLAGGLAFAVDASIWNTAVNLTTAANATLLGNTAPIWVGLGVWLILREKLHPLYWLGLVMAMGGMALIIGLDAFRGDTINPGNLLAAGAGIAYAIYQIVTSRARAVVDNLTYVWAFSATGAITLVFVTQALGHPLFGLPARSYLALLALGLISHTCGWLLLTYAFGHLRASFLSVALLGQPIVTALVAMPLLGEIPGGWQIAGGLATLAGIYTVHHSTLRAAQQASPNAVRK